MIHDRINRRGRATRACARRTRRSTCASRTCGSGRTSTTTSGAAPRASTRRWWRRSRRATAAGLAALMRRHLQQKGEAVLEAHARPRGRRGRGTVNAPRAAALPPAGRPTAISRGACARPSAATCCSTAPSRGRYATDASIYQVEPVGVLVPASDADVRAAFDVCRELRIPMLPRGAGSSQCGQTVGAALVIDHSKHLNKVVAFDADARTVTVEPGIVLDALNAWLKPHGAVVPGRRQHVGAGARWAAWPATTRAARARSRTATWCTTSPRSTRCWPTARAARFGPERGHAGRGAARARARRRAARDRRARARRDRGAGAVGAAPRGRLQHRRVQPGERAAVHARRQRQLSRTCSWAAKARSRGRAR